MSKADKGVQSPLAKANNSVQGGDKNVTQKNNKSSASVGTGANKPESNASQSTGRRGSDGKESGRSSNGGSGSGHGRSRRDGSRAERSRGSVPKGNSSNRTKRGGETGASRKGSNLRDERNVRADSNGIENILRALWIAIVADIAPVVVDYFSQQMQSMDIGLFIAKANRVAECLLQDKLPLLEDEVMFDVVSSLRIDIALQILRFGKRYAAPVDEMKPKDKNAVVSKFLQRNKRNRDINDMSITMLPYFLEKELHRIGLSIFSCAHERMDTDRTLEKDISYLPQGTTAEGFKLPFEKWCSVHASYKYYGSEFIHAGISHHELDDDLWYVPSVLRLVPKDFRDPRLIMEEPLERTLRQSYIADFLKRVIQKPSFSPYAADRAITLDDQTQNGQMALLGSIDKSLCTIDLSNASDCITARLVQACFPAWIATLILHNCSHRVELPDGRVVRLHMPMTMGSRVTVPGQSLVYWIIICAAYDYGRAHCDVSKYSLSRCSVYNDDIIVPLDMYGIVVEFLTLCGLIVNDDKSFTGDSPFRESCGVDAWDGSVVTSIYWPRKEMKVEAAYLPSWIALHNRLYDAGMRGAATYVSTIVDSVVKNVPRVLPSSQDMGIKSLERSLEVTPYVRWNYDVYVQVTPWSPNSGLHINGVVPEKIASVTIKASNFRPGHTSCITEWSELRALLSPYSYVCFDGSRTWYPTALCPRTGKIRRYDLQPVDGFHTITQYELRQVYDNKVSTSCFDRTIVSPALMEYLWADYAYSHSLLYGPEYPDEICELLHVSVRRNVRKTQVANGFKARRVSHTQADPAVIEAASQHFNKKLRELQVDDAPSVDNH